MRRFTNTAKTKNNRGFSLIEVIVAVGILAGSALAIIAFLGATSQATSEVLDRTVAARIADNVRAELEATDIGTLINHALPTNPIELYATKDGERVRLGGTIGNVDNHPISGTPPGIADRDRYFLIEIRTMEDTPLEPSGGIADSAMLPLSVQVTWPYQLPLGPASSTPQSDPFSSVERSRQSIYIFNTVILRKQ